MGWQVVVGVSKVPDIVNQDVNPDHIRPDHVLFVFGGVNLPPAGHTEDIQDTGDTVHDVMPAAIEPNALGGLPPAVPAFDGRLKITADSNHNVDGYDDKGERLKPMGFADAPLVFNHHKADTSCQSCIEFCVVEPAVHVQIGAVV